MTGVQTCALPILGFGDNREFVSSWSKRWDDDNDDIVRFNENVKARIDIATGHYKNYHMPLVIKSYKDIVFYARGDVKEVERLLTTYISYIGKKAAQGYGEIGSLEIEEIDKDYSTIKDDVPTRPIPVDNYPEYLEQCIKNDVPCIISIHPAGPPYWRTDNLVRCYMPT